jgi:hypothetical protein
MRRLAIAALLLATPAHGQGGEAPDFPQALVAAGVIITSSAMCADVRVDAPTLAAAQRLEAIARADGVYWRFYDAGVAVATRSALLDMDAFCEQARAALEGP